MKRLKKWFDEEIDFDVCFCGLLFIVALALIYGIPIYVFIRFIGMFICD